MEGGGGGGGGGTVQPDVQKLVAHTKTNHHVLRASESRDENL